MKINKNIFYPPPTIETISLSPSLSFTSPHFFELIIKLFSSTTIFDLYPKEFNAVESKNFLDQDLIFSSPLILIFMR